MKKEKDDVVITSDEAAAPAPRKKCGRKPKAETEAVAAEATAPKKTTKKASAKTADADKAPAKKTTAAKKPAEEMFIRDILFHFVLSA